MNDFDLFLAKFWERERLGAARRSDDVIIAARVVMDWYERDGSVGGAVEPFRELKRALDVLDGKAR